MKFRHSFLIFASPLAAILLNLDGAAMGQDVAAAARANRESHAKVEASNPGNGWSSPTSVTLRTLGGHEDDNVTYQFANNQDLKITMGFKEKGIQQTGELMLINGRRQWMLAKNVPLEKGYEIDALDGAILSLKLVLELLRTVIPAGPSELKEKMSFNVHEQKRSIAVNTASASGGLEAPWSLEATVEPTTTAGLAFELKAKHNETMHLVGTWKKESSPPIFGDDFPLDGWKIFSIGPIKTTDENGTILDYGAQASEKHPRTLGELRNIVPSGLH